MATANEVLEQMEQHPELYVSADVCIVDPVTRTISVPDAYRILGVESDESVKVVPFQCPKMVEDDVDLTDFTLYINYVNAGGDFDIYSIENVKESGENITFDWIIRRSVTARRGTIRFILCAKRSDDEGNIIQEWNTTINDECESLEGLEGAPSIADQFPDIIQQILEKLQEIIDGGGGTGGPVDQEQIQQAVNDYLTKNPPSGMTTEQQQQLTKNTNDITDLKSAMSKTSQMIIGDGISNIVVMSQDEYDMIEKDPETIYIIENTEAYLIFDESQESYVLTDYTPNTGTTYELSIRVPAMIYRGFYLSTMISGREPNYDYSVMCAGAGSSANYMQLSHANGAYADVKISSGKTSKHVYKRTPTELFLDGISQKTVSAGTQQGNGPFVIGLPAADATHVRNTFHFFGLKIYENDELLHDYRPSKGTNGAACVFDTITRKYFYNSGTGSLTYTRGET